MTIDLRKLAEQAGFDLIDIRDQFDYNDVSPIKEFTRLIVAECIDVISPYAVRMENFDGGHPIADLKKHFGVEE